MTPQPNPPAWLPLATILGVSAIGVGGIVVLEWLRPDIDRGIVIAITGFLAPTVVSLLALARATANGRSIEAVGRKTDNAAWHSAVAADAAAAAAERAVANEAKLANTAAAVKKLTEGGGS